MKVLRSVAILALLAVTARGDDWSQLGRDDARRRLPAESLANPSFLASVATGADSIASPVAVDGYLVLAGTDGSVRALNEGTRATVWTVSTGSPVIATPMADRGRVYVPGLDGTLRILRLADGTSLGSISVGGSGHSSPLLTGGRIYLAAAFPNPTLGAWNAATGASVWSASLDQVTYSSPAVGGGLVVIATNNGTLSAFDAATGAPAWSIAIGGMPGASAPLILGSSVYLMVDGTLVRTDLATGAISGSVALAQSSPADTISIEWACSSLSVAGGMLVGTVRVDYALDHTFDGYVDAWTMTESAWSIDPAAMSVNWQTPLGSAVDVGLNAIPPYRIMPAPVSLGGDIAFGSSLDADLRLLTAGGGASATFALDGPSLASPMLANARLYALTRPGTLQVFEDAAAPQPAPAAGLAPDGAHLAAGPATLSWSAGPVGASYTVRLAEDGEILMSFDLESTVGALSVPCPALAPERQYTWAVRVRDASGAYAPWTTARFAVGTPPQPPSGLTATPKHARVVLAWTPSPSADVTGYRVAHGATGGPLGAPVDVGNVSTAAVGNLLIGTEYTFEVTAVDSLGFVSAPVSTTSTPVSTIDFGGTLYPTIAAALAAATAGDTVPLAADVYAISATLVIPPGVTLRGVNGLDTRIVATAAIVMIDAGTGAAVRNLSLGGGSIGVQATGQSVVVSHCVIAGMTDAGIDAPGIVTAVNNTIVNNATAGVRAAGRAHVRNSIVQGNGTGLLGTVISKYNDVSDGYSGCVPGEGDRSTPVLFVDPASGDYREQSGQPSLDSGAPEDAYSNEPSHNGYRINMGAFGNTALAATSPESDKSGSGGSCGLLGLEVLALLGLLALRRR